MHVRDLDAIDRPCRDPERERPSGVVGVDVHLQRIAVSDDEQRVAELVELRLERARLELVALDEEDGAVAVARVLLVDRLDGDVLGGHGRRRGQRLAADGRRDPPHDLDEPGAPRIHDSRLAQHVEQLRRTRQRVLAAGEDLREEIRHGRQPRRLSLLRHLPDHGQHRPLDRPAHRPVGSVRRAPKRARDCGHVDVLRRAERLGGTADDLREDDTRVPARSHQRGARQLPGERRAVGGLERVELLDHRAGRQRQVRAGVAIWDRIDVEVVDVLPARFQRRQRAAGQRAQLVELGHALRRTSSMCTSTRATRRPVRRSTS